MLNNVHTEVQWDDLRRSVHGRKRRQEVASVSEKLIVSIHPKSSDKKNVCYVHNQKKTPILYLAIRQEK